MFLLEKGASGSIVTGIQVALHMLRFYRMSIDGHFGEGTKSAVMDFQETFELDETGAVNQETYAAIRSEVAPILKALKAKGYNIVNTSGVCSMTDYNELLEFQSDNNLTTDGFVGPATRHCLFSTMNVTSSSVFQSGDKGEEVKTLQYALTVLCCHPGPIDGSFGPQTLEAVKVYQGKHGYTKTGTVNQTLWNSICSQISIIMAALDAEGYEYASTGGIADKGFYDALKKFQRENDLVVDGLCGPATRAALGLSYASENDSFPLSKGSSGNNVLNLQYALWLLQIDPNGFDSSFGNGCKNAVQAYQTRKSMTVTGIVDTATWEAIRADILPIQQALVNHGYSINGNPDGVATKATYDAVKAFQTDHNLTADGLVGTATKAALGISSGTYTGTTTAYVVRGSKGSIVRYIQKVLNYLGYTIDVDGSFGPAMESVVMDFQEDNDLDSDGHFGPASWRKLFELYNPTITGTTAAEKLVSVAQHELAFAFAEDNSNNITPYGQWYDLYESSWNGQAWCAMFVTFCARKAGIAGTTVPEYAYCPSGVEWYRSRKRYFKRLSDYTPSAGDVVFFYSSDLGRVAHTGIVVENTGTHIRTIEGNASDGVRSRYYSTSDSKIDGYGCNAVTVPYTIPTQQQVDDELAQIYFQVRSLYGVNGTDTVFHPVYSEQPTGEDMVTITAGIEENTSDITGMHFYLIEDHSIPAMDTALNDYWAMLGTYAFEEEIRNTVNRIESYIENGEFGYKAYESPANKIITEVYFRYNFRNASGQTKTFYVRVVHSVDKTKYLHLLNLDYDVYSDRWSSALTNFNTDQVAELVYVLNRITARRKYKESCSAFVSFVDRDFKVLCFTLAKETRKNFLEDVIDYISHTLKTFIDAQSFELSINIPFLILDTGYLEITMKHGVTKIFGEGALNHSIGFTLKDAYASFLNNVDNAFSAAYGNDVTVSTVLDNLFALGTEFDTGSFSTAITFETGHIEFKFRIEIPDSLVIPDATGGYYIEISVKFKDIDPLEYGLQTSPVEQFNYEMRAVQDAIEQWAQEMYVGLSMVIIAIAIAAILYYLGSGILPFLPDILGQVPVTNYPR